jgi:hypothetical protein
MAQIPARDALRNKVVRRVAEATTTLRRTAASWLTSDRRRRDAEERTR